MEENIVINSMKEDRISQLPEPVLHHILWFLESPADLVRSSVLSKRWFTLTASFPILRFALLRFIEFLDESGVSILDFLSRGDLQIKFWKYVAYTMCRFCKENVSARIVSLDTVIQSLDEAAIIDRFIESSIKKGVQVLDIHLCNLFPVQPPSLTYRLPYALLSASSITYLSLGNCEFPSSLMTHAVIFKSLKIMVLVRMHVDDELIKNLTTSCRLLQNFELRGCYGFKRVCIEGPYNLQKVRIDYMGEVERIDIEAPNLSQLFLSDVDGIGAPSMNLTSCKKLTTLCFCAFFSLNPKGFDADFLINFPFIKNLFLNIPQHCNNLVLSSNSLKTLVLHSQCDLDEVEIKAPNMLFFKYSRRIYLFDKLPQVRNLVESKPQLECYPDNDVDTIWFRRLRCFLNKRNGFEVLKLKIRATFIDLKELEVIPSYELKHVELELHNIKELSVYVFLVDVVLCCCRPRSLILVSDYSSIDLEEMKHVVKFTHEKLLQQENHQGHSNIRLVLSSSSKAKTHFSDLDSLLTALSRDQPRQRITFTKEKESVDRLRHSTVVLDGR